MLAIQKVSAELIYPIRHEVLRPGLPPESAIFDCDQNEGTFHLAAFKGKLIVGAATFTPEKFEDLPSPKPYRLRGMATDAHHRGQGIGRLILLSAEAELRSMHVTLLWFNAREVAFPFYSKLGFQFLGEIFDIPCVGPHKVMYKYL